MLQSEQLKVCRKNTGIWKDQEGILLSWNNKRYLCISDGKQLDGVIAMPSLELALAKREDVVEYYCKGETCQRIAMLLKQKEEREAESDKLREIFSFAAGKFE